MTINKILSSFILMLYVFSSLTAQNSESEKFDVFQIGISPNYFANFEIRDNVNFESDSLVFNPQGTFGSNTSLDFHFGYQKFGTKRNVFSLGAWGNFSKADLFLRQTDLESELVSFEDFSREPMGQVKVDDIKRQIIGLEGYYSWRSLNPPNKHFFINIGIGVQAMYFNEDYFTFTQSTRTINPTQKSAAIINIIAPIDIYWRFTEKFSIGLNLGFNMFSKYIVLNNDLNLDKGNPLNDAYFRNPYDFGQMRLVASYFIKR